MGQIGKTIKKKKIYKLHTVHQQFSIVDGRDLNEFSVIHLESILLISSP